MVVRLASLKNSNHYFCHNRKRNKMSYENILVTQENAVATITINRPSKLNALNKATIEELSAAFTSLNNDEAVKAIILTG